MNFDNIWFIFWSILFHNLRTKSRPGEAIRIRNRRARLGSTTPSAPRLARHGKRISRSSALAEKYHTSRLPPFSWRNVSELNTIGVILERPKIRRQLKCGRRFLTAGTWSVWKGNERALKCLICASQNWGAWQVRLNDTYISSDLNAESLWAKSSTQQLLWT